MILILMVEGSQDGATNPYGVFTLRGSNDLDLDGGGSKGGDFLLHTISNTRVHGGTTRHNIVGKEIFTDINVTPHNGVEYSFMNTNRFHTQERWLEKCLRGSESFVANSDDLTVRKLVGLVNGRRCRGCVHLGFEVKGDVAQLLLDVANNFSLSGGGEGVAALSHDLHQVGSQVATSQVQTEDGVGKGVTFVDRDGVGDTITGVQDNTGGTARGVEGEDSLDCHVHGG